MRRPGAALVAGSALGFTAWKAYRLLTSGALTLDLGVAAGCSRSGRCCKPSVRRKKSRST